MHGSPIIGETQAAGEASPAARAAFYIDGFNFYHAVAELEEIERHYKWLDWWRLAQMIAGNNFSIARIVLCTATPAHKPYEVQERHRNYMNALRATGVFVREGWFLAESRKCGECHSLTTTHREKEGDVSLAVAMVEDAYEDRYDHAFLVSNDSDHAPALRVLKYNFGPGSSRHKTTTAVFPAWRKENITSLKLGSLASRTQKISKPMLKACLLPPTVQWTTKKGHLRLIRRPLEYAPPESARSL